MDEENCKLLNKEYSNALLQGLNSLREESQFCDITIKVGGKDFPAHKAVLAATSSYFKVMFMSGFKESQQREVTIDGNPEVFEALLEFAYTGCVDLVKLKSHMFDMFQLSLYLDFKVFSQSCARVIEKLITSKEECVSVAELCKILFMALDHDNDDEQFWELERSSRNFLMGNLEVLKDTEEFLQYATMVILGEVLGDEGLATEEEEVQVLTLVMNWLKYNWEKRQEYALQLLQKIRLGLVSPEDIKELIGPEIYEIPGCSELLSKVEKLRDSGKSKYTLATEETELFATRSTVTAQIVAVREDGYPTPGKDSFQYYDDGWRELKNFTQPHHMILSMIVADGSLYATCKTNLRYKKKDFHRYDAKKNKWNSLQPPLLRKDMKHCQMVHVDGFIYILSGNGGKSAQDVEQYDISQNRWNKVRQLPFCPYKLSAVAFKGRICVTALVYDREGRPYNELLIYHPIQDVWQRTDVLIEWDNARGLDQLFSDKTLLFIHKEQCYIVVSQAVTGICNVSVLDLQVCDDDDVICAIKDEIKQEPVPDGKNTFRIQDKVFVINQLCRSVYAGRIAHPLAGNITSNVVTFTYDKRKVHELY